MEVEYLNDTDTLIFKLGKADMPWIDEIKQELGYMLWEQRYTFF